MRKRFEQQTTIGRLLIQDAEVPTAKRSGALPGLSAALKEIFVTAKWNEKVFEVLEKQYSQKTIGQAGREWTYGKFLYCRKCVFARI